MNGLLQILLALMAQPLREFMEDENNIRALSLEDVVKLQSELHKVAAALADEIRRCQREDWESS